MPSDMILTNHILAHCGVVFSRL